MQRLLLLPTIIIATHDNEIAAQADRVIALKDGRLCD